MEQERGGARTAKGKDLEEQLATGSKLDRLALDINGLHFRVLILLKEIVRAV